MIGRLVGDILTAGFFFGIPVALLLYHCRQVLSDRKGMTEADARVALYSEARKHRVSR